MRDTLFIQFYNQSKNGYYDLCNGFSDTYDLCKSRGEFHWVHHQVDRTRWLSYETYADHPLPLQQGTVYVSALSLEHLYQSYVWAREYPDVRFIVGGPVAAEREADGEAWHPVYVKLEATDPLPSNLVLTGKSVEDWFGVPNFSGTWNLPVPGAVPAEARIYFSYTLDNGCYWKKCVYCNIALHAQTHFRRRTTWNFEFHHMDHPGPKIVRLNTGSLTPHHIRTVLPNLPCGPDLDYRAFLRTAKAENMALKDVLEERKGAVPRLMLGLGIEFPSNRMWRYVEKGFDREDVLECLRICAAHGIRTNGNFILGWDNLTEEDLRELEHFMEHVPDRAMQNAQVRWLFAHPYTKIHDRYDGDPIRLGPFYAGFRVRVSEEQKALNKTAAEIIAQYSRAKHCNVEGLSNLEAE